MEVFYLNSTFFSRWRRPMRASIELWSRTSTAGTRSPSCSTSQVGNFYATDHVIKLSLSIAMLYASDGEILRHWSRYQTLMVWAQHWAWAFSCSTSQGGKSYATDHVIKRENVGTGLSLSIVILHISRSSGKFSAINHPNRKFLLQSFTKWDTGSVF